MPVTVRIWRGTGKSSARHRLWMRPHCILALAQTYRRSRIRLAWHDVCVNVNRNYCPWIEYRRWYCLARGPQIMQKNWIFRSSQWTHWFRRRHERHTITIVAALNDTNPNSISKWRPSIRSVLWRSMHMAIAWPAAVLVVWYWNYRGGSGKRQRMVPDAGQRKRRINWRQRVQRATVNIWWRHCWRGRLSMDWSPTRVRSHRCTPHSSRAFSSHRSCAIWTKCMAVHCRSYMMRTVVMVRYFGVIRRNRSVLDTWAQHRNRQRWAQQFDFFSPQRPISTDAFSFSLCSRRCPVTKNKELRLSCKEHTSNCLINLLKNNKLFI